jgi:hypothetical protein
MYLIGQSVNCCRGNYKLQPIRCNFSSIYFYRRSTCFRRFLRPSSGEHNCTYSFRHCKRILLLAATVDKILSILSSQNIWLTTHVHVDTGLRIGGAIPPLPLYALKTCVGKSLLLPFTEGADEHVCT